MKIPGPQFEVFETVAPTEDAPVKPAASVGKVESRAWVEYGQQPGCWRYTVRWPMGGLSSESDEHLQMADRLYCDLKILVNGVALKFESWTTESVDVLIERALDKADFEVRPEEWTLRTAEGAEIKHLVGDAGLHDGATLLVLNQRLASSASDDPAEQIAPVDVPGEQVLRDNPHLPEGYADGLAGKLLEIGERRRAGSDDGWKGTPPAEGTRRKLILDAIKDASLSYEFNRSTTLHFADAVESALLQSTIDDEAMARGAEALAAGITKVDPYAVPSLAPIHTLLDEVAIPRTAVGDGPEAIFTLRERVEALITRYKRQVVPDSLDRDATPDHPPALATLEHKAHALLDRAEVERTQGHSDDEQRILTLAERLELLVERAELFTEELDEKLAADDALAGNVPAGTRELHIVLADESTPSRHRQVFVELEDQDGAGVGGFEHRPDRVTGLIHIVIPYGRDDAWVSEVAHQAAGAAAGVFLRADWDQAMPAEEISAAVAEILTGFGISKACDDCAAEQLEHGHFETSGQVWPKGSPEYRRVMAGKSNVDVAKATEEILRPALEEISEAYDKQPPVMADDPDREAELLEQREEARVGEGHWKAQRDAALGLLRWLIGDVIEHRSDV